MLTLLDPDTTTVEQLKECIETFDSLPAPSSYFLPGMLDGMNTISQRMIELLPDERIRPIVEDTEKGANTALN